MKRISLTTFLILLLIHASHCQIKTEVFSNGDAFSIYPFLSLVDKTMIPEISMSSFDVNVQLEEDEHMIKEAPFRFGKGFDVSLSIKDGKWINNGDQAFWSLIISSKNAFSINLILSDLFLPKGSELYIYNREGSMVQGPITHTHNVNEGTFLTDILKGDQIIIRIIGPKINIAETKITIRRIIHGYRDLFPESAKSSGSCNNNVMCFPTWETASDAVALVLLADGGSLCTGCLVNNTSSNYRPFFLTAFHCIDIAGGNYYSGDYADGILQGYEIDDAENWSFRFRYKNTTCSGSVISTYYSYLGANFRAAWFTTDFALLELVSDQIITEASITRLGWDRTGNTPSTGIGIHHPSGDVMKISFDDDNLSETYYFSDFGFNYWRVDWDNGVTETGSSGSPLLDQNNRVIGQLKGGWSDCSSNDMRDWYGCFDLSWTGGGTNTTRLSNWLDPLNTGYQTLDMVRPPGISGTKLVCSSPNVTFTLNNRPPGTTVMWRKSNNLIYVSGDTTNNYAVRASVTKGIGWVQSTVYFGTDSLVLPQYPVWVGAPTNATGHNVYYIDNYGLEEDTYCLDDSYSFYLDADVSQYSNKYPNGLFTLYYDWIVDGYSATTDSYTYTVFTGYTEKITDLKVSMRNTCGSSRTYRYFYEIVNCSSRWTFSISPNPAEDFVQIEFFEMDPSGLMTSITELTTANCLFSIVLHDQFLRPLKMLKSYGELVTLSVSDLVSGTYILKVNNSNKQLSKILIIK